ncbi:hypothetical protein JW796_03760 [Candidatus Dojkabacteria bacterium]|nr:hypothetical protein [Candidatus Dojkabacteria bacterium]
MAQDNVAVVLPPNLSKEVKKIQKEMKLESPGEVISKGLALLKLAMGRRVKLESGGEKLEIDDFKEYNQTFKYEDGIEDN